MSKTVTTPKAPTKSQIAAAELTAELSELITSGLSNMAATEAKLKETHKVSVWKTGAGFDTWKDYLISVIGTDAEGKPNPLYLSKKGKPEVAVWLHADGMVSRDIAELLDCSKSGVAKWLNPKKDEKPAATADDSEGEGSEPTPAEELTPEQIADKVVEGIKALLSTVPEDKREDVLARVSKLALVAAA